MKASFKNKTQALLFLVLSLSFLTLSSFSRKKDPVPSWNYEVECTGTAIDGSYLIKVWSYSKTPNIDPKISKKNAVHSVLFKGYPGKPGGCTSQGALIKDPSVAHSFADYFEAFFKQDQYLKYVNLSSSVPEVIKTDKKQYKIAYIVSVSKDHLRKDLESANIIKSLNSGF